MSKGAFNRFLLKSSQIIIRFSHPGITVYQQQFFSSSLSLSSFPFPLNRSILPLRQQLKLVVGGQRCTSFPSTNSMPSSSCCYHFTTTATATTTTTTTTSKATTRNKTNVSTRFSSNGTCILDNIPLDRYVDNYFTGIKDGGQTVYIIEEHKNNNSSLDNYQHASSEGNISWGFSSTLLWVNDPQYIHPTSGQRVKTLGQYSKNLSIICAEIIYSSIDDDNNDDDEGDSLYPSPPQGSLHSRGEIYCNHSNNNSHDKTNHIDSGDRIRRALLKIVWSSKEESTFDVNWLIDLARNNCIGWMSKEDEKEQIGGQNSFLDSIDDHHVQATSSMTTNLIKTTSVTKDIALGAIDNTDSASIRIFDYKEIMENENNLFQGMQGIFENGAILIRNSPARTTENVTTITREGNNDVSRVEEESIVGNLGKRFSGGKLSHGSLYGDIFHVQTKNGAENIAYTNLALPPHQDLTYYDSKPFLQLLHCVTIDTINDIDNENENENENENGIAGGDSVLIDAIAAAEELRHIAPDLFYTLCKTEATFLKERHDVDMVSLKSHIVTDPTYGQVIEVNWSPPFEGPLQIHPNIPVEDYVLAYQAMECMLDHDKRITRNSSNDDDGCLTLLPPSLENRLRNHAKQYTWEYSLQKGDILVFNNQRMLHGRRGFISFGNTKRHLIGCYTDTMDTISRYRLLLRDRNEENGRGGYGRRNPGNGSRWM
mmetsp:Transcript_11651/g.13201  ORF Transcript_11651/g.13201 Transcript_11651/m.13201 type:complete len:711 (+) Transcript_11651:169-2301(+)